MDNNIKRPQVIMTAGGTGGHVFPALALARAYQGQGYDVHWLGTQKGIEAKVVPEAGFTMDWINISGFRGKSITAIIKFPFKLLHSVLKARRVIKRMRPELVIGFGGFVSVPGALAAWSLRVPLVIHEQNAVPGTANRYLFRLAKMVMCGFDGVFKAHPKVVVTGNPLREDLAQFKLDHNVDKTIRSFNTSRPLRVLVFGGSLGAKFLNEMVPNVLVSMAQVASIEVWHQGGQANYDTLTQSYKSLHDKTKVSTFIDEMAKAYAWADLVICRSGALTVSEIIATQMPSILVPLPNAIDDHQRLNAHVLSSHKACILFDQAMLTETRLYNQLLDLYQNPDRLNEMRANLGALQTSNATHQCFMHSSKVAKCANNLSSIERN